MIIEEETVIILDDGNQYFLAHEIGELEGYPNKTFYFSVGVTEDEKINIDDICFIQIEKENGEVFATKVPENTELFQVLITLENLAVAVEENPSIKDKITEELENLSQN